MTNNNLSQAQSESWMGKTYNTDDLIKKIMPDTSILNKHYDTDTFFRKLVDELKSKPIWVKQAIFVELRDDMKRMSDVDLLEALDKNDLLQLYVPRLSNLGVKILANVNYSSSITISADLYNFLQEIDSLKNVIDICYKSNWSLKYFSRLIIESENKGLIEQIRSNQITNLFKYIADEIDIGNLMLKLNRLTPDQLSFAQFSLAEMQKTFTDSTECSLEDVITRLGYIDKDKLNSILVLKKASEIPFGYQEGMDQLSNEHLQESIEFLEEENKQISEELNYYKPLIEAKDKRIKELETELKMYKEELLKVQKNPGMVDVFKKL